MSDADKYTAEVIDGGLRYQIHDQSGGYVTMTCADTPDMRRFVNWLFWFDRYGPDNLDEVRQDVQMLPIGPTP